MTNDHVRALQDTYTYSSQEDLEKGTHTFSTRDALLIDAINAVTHMLCEIALRLPEPKA